ncbi:MAG: hypothetical protein WA979_00815 [Pacificimonas sp.]
MMRAVRKALLVGGVASACVCSVPASAQYAAGLRAPEGISDGLAVAFGMGCVFAASQRLAPGLNYELGDGADSVTLETSLPDDVARFMPAAEADAKILRYETPEGDVWTLYNEAVDDCTVAAYSDTPEDASEMALQFVQGKKSDWRKVDGEEVEGVSVRTFSQKFKATPQLILPEGKMTAEFRIPSDSTQPIVIRTVGSDFSGPSLLKMDQ